MKAWIILLLCISFSPFAQSNPRSWTDTKGRKIEATLIGADATSATLKRAKDNREFKISLSKLSKNDRFYVEVWIEEQKKTPTQESPKSTPTTEKPQPVDPPDGDRPVDHPELPENYEAPWPQKISIKRSGAEVRTVKEDAESREFIYHSPHFQFTSDSKLPGSQISEWALLFEATREYCQLLPLSLKRAHAPSDARKNPIQIFGNQKAYIEAGGAPNTFGAYKTKSNLVIVSLDGEAINGTLIHEVTHQLSDTPFRDPVIRWIMEGFAEYISFTPYRNGTFERRKVVEAIKQAVIAHGLENRGGRNLGTKIECGSLQKFIANSIGKQFVSNHNYGVAALLVTHFIHFDGKGDGEALKAYFKTVRLGQRGEKSFEALRNGRTWNELENEISAAWKKEGVTLEFSEK